MAAEAAQAVGTAEQVLEVALPARALTWQDLQVVPVAGRDDVLAQRIVAPLVPVVEVLSPSPRAVDRSLERLVHQETGVAHRWIVDPRALGIQARALRDGAHVLVGTAHGDQPLHLDAPFAPDVVPSALPDE